MSAQHLRGFFKDRVCLCSRFGAYGKGCQIIVILNWVMCVFLLTLCWRPPSASWELTLAQAINYSPPCLHDDHGLNNERYYSSSLKQTHSSPRASLTLASLTKQSPLFSTTFSINAACDLFVKNNALFSCFQPFCGHQTSSDLSHMI